MIQIVLISVCLPFNRPTQRHKWFYIRVFITFITHVSAGKYGQRRVVLQ